MKKKIIILGNSIGVVKLIEDIRLADQESEIILLCPDGQLPYHRQRLAELVAKEISLDQILVKPPDFYVQNNVTQIFEKKITKINFRKSQITLEEKEIILDYDVLAIASLPDKKMLDIKGINKTGIYVLDSLADINQFLKELPFIDTVTIQSNSSVGLKMAQAIRKIEKEVLLVVESPQVTHAETFSPSTLQEQGIRLMQDNPIIEILGEGDARAVRFKSEKVIASDAIFFGELNPNFRLFQDTSLSLQDRIVVDATYKTNIDNVYALDEAIEDVTPLIFKTPDVYATKACEQVRVVVAHMNGLQLSLSTQANAHGAAETK